MLPPPAYFTILALCWIYAELRGGVPERIGATIMVVGSALTWAVVTKTDDRFGSVEVGVLVVDFVAFVAFAIVALRTDRFWPIWASAFAGLAVLGHLARWYPGGEVTPWAYYVTIVVWTYPILALIAIGTLNHQRREARRLGSVPDQSQARP